MIAVQVWPDPRARGWSGDPLELDDPKGPPEHRQVDLAEALGDLYDTDAHLAPYAVYQAGEPVPNAPRVRKAALEHLATLGLEVRVGCAVLDVDAPKLTVARGGDAVADWYESQVGALELARLDPAYRYRTRGGYRLIWQLDRPVDPGEYERLAANLRAEVRRRTDGTIDPDEACSDWTRCYRLPGVVRDGERQEYPLEQSEDPATLSARDLLGARTEGARALEGLGSARARFELPEAIPAGERDATLARYAGRLAGRGLAEGEVAALLEVAIRERCEQPPGDEKTSADAERIARSIGAAESAKRASAPPDDDVGLTLGSEAEVARYVLGTMEASAPRLRHDRGRLWRYAADEGVWRPVRPSEVYGAVTELDGTWYGVGKGRRRLKVGARTCSHVLELVRSYRDSPGWFGRAAGGVAFAGGTVVRVDGGRLEASGASPDHRLTHALPFAWDPKAGAPTFEGVIARAFRGCADADERRELLLGFAGTCLVGRATTYQKALLLVGEGANGKSTLMDAVAALFPSGARCSIPPQLLGDPYHRAELAGALINVVSEVPETDIVAAEAFRAFVTGDEIPARRIREAPFSYRPRAGHLWAANNMPGARDFSDAFWRRWLVVHFPNAIPEAERDPKIVDRIRGELPGVARLVLEAAARVEARGGYLEPASSRRSLDAWRRDADQVAAFAEDRLEAASDADEAVPASRLYDAYRVWATRNGHRPLSNRRFGERLVRLGFRRAQRTASGRRWLARLRPTLGHPVAVNPRSAGGNAGDVA